MTDNTEKIRQLNDAARKREASARWLFVGYLGDELHDDATRLDSIMKTVSEYADFDQGNDPYGEHDFGSFTFGGEQISFKIDYYDLNFENGSDDPADPEVTGRLISVFYTKDY